MNKQQLEALIRQKKSYLCVGLDTDINLIPGHLKQHSDPVFEFNKAIIDATLDVAVAYKPNLAFYESMGLQGWRSLEKTMEYLQQFKGQAFSIADAKRGDIGNTSKMYAKTFFEWLQFDSVTVAPYMGEDSVTPFLEYADKWVILLGLTSNTGSKDFQFLQTGNRMLFEEVMTKAQQWASAERMMFVTGATHPEMFAAIRAIAPEHFLLVPGVGAQGGTVQDVSEHGMNQSVGLLVNSTRQVIYAGKGEDFAEKARAAALDLQQQMQAYLV